jgi:hypothetical protein
MTGAAFDSACASACSAPRAPAEPTCAWHPGRRLCAIPVAGTVPSGSFLVVVPSSSPAATVRATIGA